MQSHALVTMCTTYNVFFLHYDYVVCPGRHNLYSVAHTFQSFFGLYHHFMESDNLRQSDFFFLISNAAIFEFPVDVFTNRQRTQGAVLLHIFAVGKLCVRTSINI